MRLTTFQNLAPAKQKRIFRAAVREFARWGFAAASINRLVDRLGIAKGSIFQYFGDKQGLFQFVFGRAVETVKDHLRAVREATREQDFFQRLEAVLLAGVAFIRQHPEVYALYTKVQFEGELDFCARLLAALRRESHDFLGSLLDDGLRRGDLPPDLDRPAAVFLLDAVLDRFLQTLVVGHLDGGLGLHDAAPPELAARVRATVDLLRRGLAA